MLWRTIPGFDPRYEVSKDGLVRSWIKPGKGGGVAAFPRTLAGTIHHNGYPIYRLRNELGDFQSVYAHQLVLAAFIGPRAAGQVTRHRNGNPRDNQLFNLVYGTNAENHSDREAHGRTAKGSRHGRAKATETLVLEIVDRYRKGEPQMSIAATTGLAQSTISSIVRGETWSAITGIR